MAAVGNTYLTLADLRKRQDENDQIARIIEILAQTNPILADMIVKECNNGTNHLTTVRTGLPSGTWRKLYQGVQPGKSTTRQVTDTTGMLEAWSEIDSKLVALSANPGEFRLSEAQAFLEGMNQDMATTLFYGDTDADPEKFMGLSARFNDLSAENGNQIIDAGGTGSDNTSIWFIVWGENTAHGLYPKGSQAGLQREDKGMQTKTLSDGSILDVHREKFTWDLGLSVRDWRYVVRIANVDVSDLIAGTVDLYKYMRKAYYKLHQRVAIGGRAAIYCTTDVLEALDAANTPTQSTSASFVRVKPMELDGREVMGYRGIPIRACDALLSNEARVV